jgi:hypothetical protein
MRILIAVLTIALLSSTAHAQGTGKGKRHRQDTQKTEDLSKKKADEKAYRDALKNIPDSKEKSDPWGKMR